jgi:hypothetical protein
MFRPSVITPPSQRGDKIQRFFFILSFVRTWVDLKGFGPFSGLPMMFRRVIFSVGIYFSLFSFFLPQTFPFQPVVMPPVVAFAVGEC